MPRSRTRRGLQPRPRAAKAGPTPKQPPRNMTRDRANLLVGRRAQRELAGAPGAIDRVMNVLRGGRTAEQEALELMLREAGAVELRKTK